MNILVICQYYYPEPFRIADICEELQKKGHEITVITGLPNYPEGKIYEGYKNGKKRKENINGVEVIRCFEIGRGSNSLMLFINYISFLISASIKILFLKKKYDVVFVNQLSPVMMAIPALVYKLISKKKVLLYCLDLWPASLAAGGIKENSFVYKLFLKLSKWIYNSSDKILVTSSMFEEYLKNTLSLKGVKINHLPQYAEDLFLKEEYDKRNKEEPFDKNYHFTFAGNVGEMQSVETIIYCAHELKADKGIKFHIVGDGSKLEENKKLAKKLELRNVMFHGRKPLELMPKYYYEADAMLVTLKADMQISYTLPGKVQSYMAAGKVIIGSINGETKRVIKESGAGYCCDAEDYRELANLVLKFKTDNENLKRQMSKNSKEYYKKKYLKRDFIKKLEENLIELRRNNV